MSSSSRDLEASGKSGAMFSCHSESGPNTFSERNRSNESGNRFESSVHSVLRIADPASDGMMTRAPPPRGLATLVVVVWPSICQGSHLTGKRGASQGSPLREAPGVP